MQSKKKPTQATEPIKKLHLNLPESVHQRLRVKCAFENRTMQDFVSDLIAKAVKDVQLPPTKGSRA
jgi:plasmid stability protein